MLCYKFISYYYNHINSLLKFPWFCQVMKFVTEEKNMIQNICLHVTQQLKHVFHI